MTLLVGHGFTLDEVLASPISAFDRAVDSVLRVRRTALAEQSRCFFLAAQTRYEDLENWLGSLTQEAVEVKPARSASNSGDALMRDMKLRAKKRKVS